MVFLRLAEYFGMGELSFYRASSSRCSSRPRGRIHGLPRGGRSAQPDARSLWESRIELGEDFFNEIIRCPIPIDLHILKAMKRSPLGLDLYLWLTYRTFGLKRPLRLNWPMLYRQFGADPAKGERCARR